MDKNFFLKSLNLLSHGLLKTHLFFLRFKTTLILLLIPLFLFAVYLSTKTRIAVRTEDFSDQNLVSFQRMEELKENFAFEDKLSLVISKGQTLDSKDLCVIHNWLVNEIDTNNNIVQVASPFELRIPDYNDEKLFYPKIIKDACAGEVNFDALKSHPLIKMFSTPDLKDVIVSFEIKPSEVPFRHGIYDYTIVKDLINSAKKALPYKVYPAGTLFFQSSVLDGIKHANVVNLVTVVLLVSIYYLFYRSALMAFIMVLIVLVTNTFIKAGMTLSGHLIDPLSSCIFLMITVAILEDFMLLSFMLLKKKQPINQAMKTLLLPSFLTSLTTAIGFGSLSVSDNPSIVHFSIWTSFGAVFEWISLFLILPAILTLFPKIKNKIENHPKPKDILPKEFIRFRLKRPFAIILAIIPFALFFVHENANLSYSPYDMFTKNHEVSDFRNYFVKTRNAEGEVSILFENAHVDMTAFIAAFKKHPMVTDAYSESAVKDQLKVILPNSLISLAMEDFRRTSIGKLFKSSISRRVVLSIKSYRTEDVPGLVADLEKICSGQCSLTSEIIASNDYAMGVLDTLYESASTGFGFILILIAWLVMATNKKQMIPILVSSLWASMALLLVVIIFKFKVNIVTCVALSVLIGAAGDNAIQFLLFSRGSLRESVNDIGESSSENFVLVMSMASTLLFSYFATPRDLSFLLILGICFMFIGDIWVLNGLVNEED